MDRLGEFGFLECMHHANACWKSASDRSRQRTGETDADVDHQLDRVLRPPRPRKHQRTSPWPSRFLPGEVPASERGGLPPGLIDGRWTAFLCRPVERHGMLDGVVQRARVLRLEWCSPAGADRDLDGRLCRGARPREGNPLMGLGQGPRRGDRGRNRASAGWQEVAGPGDHAQREWYLP